MNDDHYATIEKENVEAAVTSHEREDDEYPDDLEPSEEESILEDAPGVAGRLAELKKAMDSASKESFRNVKSAVENAAKGEEPLTTEELAQAIVVGLFPWGPQTPIIEAVARAMLVETGKPFVVYNREEEGEAYVKEHPEQK